MSALGPVLVGALCGALAGALARYRSRPPRWLRPSTNAAQGYAAIMAAVQARQSYPLRHRLLARLNEGTASPADLAGEAEAALPAVTHHVDSLLAAGRIERVTEHSYRAVETASHSDDEWAALTTEERAQITHNNVNRMVADLTAAADGGGFQHRRSHQSWVHFELDERGFTEVAEVLEHALNAILQIRDDSRDRIEHGAGEVHVDSEVVIAHFVRGHP